MVWTIIGDGESMIRRLFLGMASATLLFALTSVARADAVGVITSNFNGTAIGAGSTVWVNSHMKVSGLSATAPTVINITNVTIAFGGHTYTMPDATITFSQTASSSSTSFDTANNRWITTVPMSLKDKLLFLSGYGWTVPAPGLPKKIANVTWSGEFLTNNPNYELDWKWAAAVYTMFSSDPNALQVKPAEGSFAAPFNNTDKPGTPEAFKTKVIKGATGNGGTDYVGGYSSSVRVETDEFCPIEEEQ